MYVIVGVQTGFSILFFVFRIKKSGGKSDVFLLMKKAKGTCMK